MFMPFNFYFLFVINYREYECRENKENMIHSMNVKANSDVITSRLWNLVNAEDTKTYIMYQDFPI